MRVDESGRELAGVATLIDSHQLSSSFDRALGHLNGHWVFFNGFQVIYYSGGSSVSQNKLLQLILEYIYILKYLQNNFIG